MKVWTKFKLIALTPLRLLKSIFNFLFPQIITLKCKTCGDTIDVDKYIFIARREAIRKNIPLEPHLELDCPFCHEKKFELVKRKRFRTFKPLNLIKKILKQFFETISNLIIFILGNIFAEIWKIISRFWQEDVYLYLKTIIAFTGICVGSVILCHLLGLEMIASFALTFVFFVINALKNIIRRK